MSFKCTDCRKKFRTEGALAMHDAKKHPRRTMVAARKSRNGLVGSIFKTFCGCLLALGAFWLITSVVGPEMQAGVTQASHVVKAAVRR